METVKLLVDQKDLENYISHVVEEAYARAKQDLEAKMADPLLTAERVAKMLDVDKSTLWRWSKRGYLVPIHIGSHIRYRKSDIEKLLQ
ncbi:MAG: helix-turn-helix domain-containing protein [Bacteroidales bacterium]|nr:helix-turn-helix domain-containing protein [Bacteroidales bacterium]